MTKQEYLNMLTARLADYPEDFQKEIEEAFESHFAEGEEAGQSEQEIIDNLGSVDEVMENIRMMYEPSSRFSSSDKKNCDDVRSSFENLSSSLRDTFVSVSAAVADSLNDAVRNINEQKKNQDRSETSGFIDDAVAKLLIRGRKGAADIHMEYGDHLEYRFKPTFSLFGGSTAYLYTETDGDTAIFEIRDGNADLYLTVPSYIAEIEYRLSSGDVKMKDIACESLYGESISGDFEADRIRCHTAEIRSTSGSAEADSSLFDSFRYQAVSGDADLNRCEGNLELKTTSGDIEISHHTGTEIRCSSVSGDIDLTSGARIVTLSTVSGDIDMRLTGEIEKAGMSSFSGDVECRIDDRRYTAVLSSASGDIENETGLSYFRSNKAYIVGNGLAEVSVETKSGDITLK